jgi:hypothetical protein
MPRHKKAKSKAQRLRTEVVATAPPAVNKERHRGVKMYCPDIVDEIITRVAEGETLTNVCNDERMPTWRTVHRWMGEYPDFGVQMAQARVLGKEYNLDYVVDIADAIVSKDDVSVARARIDQRWRIIERDDALKVIELKKAIDPKLVEAAPDKSGEWRVLENGETANPLKDALDMFRRKRGLTVNGT